MFLVQPLFFSIATLAMLFLYHDQRRMPNKGIDPELLVTGIPSTAVPWTATAIHLPLAAPKL
jgi:hypothetical protein